MAKYSVSGWVSMSVCAEVEAETEEQAKEAFLALQPGKTAWKTARSVMKRRRTRAS